MPGEPVATEIIFLNRPKYFTILLEVHYSVSLKIRRKFFHASFLENSF